MAQNVTLYNLLISCPGDISWRLEPTDKLPVGKKPCLSLRELEKQGLLI